jgi:hypothetical protein
MILENTVAAVPIKMARGNAREPSESGGGYGGRRANPQTPTR